MITTSRLAIGFIVLGLSILVVPGQVANHSRSTTKAPLIEGRLVIPNPVPLTSLDPQQVVSATEKSLLLLTFSRLVKSGDELQIEPDLLEKWTYDINHKTLTLHIRPGVRFHNGKDLTSQDVLFSFHEWARGNSLDRELLYVVRGLEAYSRGKTPRISGIKVVDHRTLKVELLQWGSDELIRNLAQPRFCIYPDQFAGAERSHFFRRPVGTGPYRVREFRPERVLYDSYTQYHFGVPMTPEMEIVHMAQDQAVESFRSGKVNNLVMYHLPEVRSLKNDGVVVKQISRASTMNLIFNGFRPELRDERVRAAVTRRIDRRELISQCFPGADEANSFIPPGLIGALRGDRPAPRFPATEEYFPASFHPTLYVLEEENGQCISQVLSRSLADLPIKIEVRRFPELYDLLKNNQLHMWFEAADFKSDDPFHNLRYFSVASKEFLLGKPIPELEKLFSQLNTDLDWAVRADLYAQIDRYLVEHRLIMPILYFNNFVVFRENLQEAEFLRSRRFSTGWHRLHAVVTNNGGGT